METTSYYQWEVAGKPVAVRLELDVVDRLLPEVLRGFGLMPRRSVEVGGLLLGSVEEAGQGKWVVSIDDFEPVPCRHTRGMGWQLSEEETARFEEVLSQWQPGQGKRTHAVGFFRSHTREGMGLSAEDQAMYQRYFSDPWAVALLVKPFASRVSVGAFFIRENGGARTDSSHLEFPFRRSDLGGEPEPEMESGGEPEPEPVREERFRWRPEASATPTVEELSAGLRAGQIEAETEGKKRKSRRGWVWLPLSFIFLLVGVLLGAYISMNLKINVPTLTREDPYGMELEAVRSSGSSVHVRWNRNAAAIRAASRGVLRISDGGNDKEVELDLIQLQTGSVIYRRASGQVRFRLEVFPKARVGVAESVEYREP